MPFYNDLRPDADFETRDFARVFPDMTEADRARCIEGLLRLKGGLAEQVPPKRTDGNLLMASWNLKEFGHTTQRLPEAYFYIAEIFDAFDLIAVQEVKSSLKDLSIVMRLLGSHWRYLVNDITDGVNGNSERSAYIYNSKRVRLSGLAGEVALWDEITDSSPLGLRQLKRSPYMTGFIAGWKKFAMVNLHLHPGAGADDVALRGEEIRLLLLALEEKRKGLWSENLVLVGDMNLYDAEDGASFAAFEAAGYSQCAALIGLDTNATQSEAYDRMYFHQNEFFRLGTAGGGAERGGVFDLFDFVYRDEDWPPFRADMVEDHTNPAQRPVIAADDAAAQRYFNIYWRRNQMSDHLPIWVELITDSSVEFLAGKRDELLGQA